jgi:hypothetical protein
VSFPVSSLLAKASESFVRVIRQIGDAVTYSRGSAAITLKCLTGRRNFEGSDEYGNVRLVWGETNFLVVAVDLVMGGMQIEPQAGDIITTSNGHRYQVAATTGGSVWEYMDPYEQIIRVRVRAMDALETRP